MKEKRRYAFLVIAIVVGLVSSLALGGVLGSESEASEEWSVPMTAETDSEGKNEYLRFGTNAGATDGYDSGIDVPHVPPGPGATFDAYFDIDDPLFPHLDKDYRGPMDSIVWTLFVKSTSEDITLTWYASAVPENVSLQMNGVDMKAVANTTLPAGEYTLTITAQLTCTLNVTSEGCCPITVGLPGGNETVPASGNNTFYYIPCDEVIDLHAITSVCCEFDTWSGDVADPALASTTVTMDDNKSVTATCIVVQYTLDVTSSGCCPIDVEDPVNDTVADGDSETYFIDGGTNVEVSADDSDECCVFDSWSDAGAQTHDVYMDGDKSVTATCTLRSYTLTVVSGKPLDGATGESAGDGWVPLGFKEWDDFQLGEWIYVWGYGFETCQTYRIWIQPYEECSSVTEGQELLPDLCPPGFPQDGVWVEVHIEDGKFGPVPIWQVPDDPEYDWLICTKWEIVADKMNVEPGDDYNEDFYNEAEDGLDAVACNEWGFHIYPEGLTIILLSLGLAAVGGYLVVRRRKGAETDS